MRSSACDRAEGSALSRPMCVVTKTRLTSITGAPPARSRPRSGGRPGADLERLQQPGRHRRSSTLASFTAAAPPGSSAARRWQVGPGAGLFQARHRFQALDDGLDQLPDAGRIRYSACTGDSSKDQPSPRWPGRPGRPAAGCVRTGRPPAQHTGQRDLADNSGPGQAAAALAQTAAAAGRQFADQLRLRPPGGKTAASWADSRPAASAIPTVRRSGDRSMAPPNHAGGTRPAPRRNAAQARARLSTVASRSIRLPSASRGRNRRARVAPSARRTESRWRRPRARSNSRLARLIRPAAARRRRWPGTGPDRACLHRQGAAERAQAEARLPVGSPARYPRTGHGCAG